MPLAAAPYCIRTDVSPSTYILNFEDTRVTTDYYYNCYIVAQQVAQGSQLTAPNVAVAGDPSPGHSISGMYKYHLVDLNDVELIETLCPGQTGTDTSNNLRWMHGDTRKPILTTLASSYGMNTLYPASMAHSGIAILDYLTLTASVAGGNRLSEEFNAGLVPTADRPAMNRHLGKFNALFSDMSVRAFIVPNNVNPTTSVPNRQQWWGE